MINSKRRTNERTNIWMQKKYDFYFVKKLAALHYAYLFTLYTPSANSSRSSLTINCRILASSASDLS